MKVHEMIPSRFLKKEDCPAPLLLTIAKITNEQVDKDSDEWKYAMWFQEQEKPLLLNSTNIQLCAAILNSDESDDWVGRKVVLYNDPTIMFAGRVTGGLRIRAPKNQPKPAPAKTAPKPAPVEEEGMAGMDDDPPF